MLSKHGTRNPQRGIALIVALLTLLLISAIAIGMLTTSRSESAINSNFKDEQVAFFAAKGGLEEVRDRLRTGAPDAFASLPSAAPGAIAANLVYVTDGSAKPWASGTDADMELCNEYTTLTCPVDTGVYKGVYSSIAASTTYAESPALPWHWVRMTVKTNSPPFPVQLPPSTNLVCWDPLKSIEVVSPTAICDPAKTPQVYLLTALAITSGGSRRMVQYDVARTIFPPLPGAMVFDGPSPSYGIPNSAAFTVNGLDAHTGPTGYTCPPPDDGYAVAAYNSASQTTLTNDIKGTGTGSGSGKGKGSSGPDRSASYTGLGGATPNVVDASSLLGPLLTVDGLQSMMDSITTSADKVWPANPSGVNLGTNDAPKINVVQGGYSLPGGASGAGILLVEGDLTILGDFSFNGLILVIGTGQIIKSGGGNGVLNGAMMVANMNDAGGNPIPLGSGNPPGVFPTINWSGGGTAVINWDSCWTDNLSKKVPYRVLATREIVN